ncbi:MAG: DUF418 domain-containing protein [Firmicutes bacterium]|nr:DUF418 domain-containing protein [Bacillota bacterium]
MTLKRDYLIDNIKGIMIFLVVLAHLFEFNITPKISFLLIIIYSFHMPVFVYYSGYLARYNASKIIKGILFPYLGIQIFSWLVYNSFGFFTDFRLITAYTSLWYMISLFFWYISIPFVENVKHPKILILLLFLFGLIIGYDATAGTILSASRTIVFVPIFYLGYFSRKYNWFNFKKNSRLFKLILPILICAIIIMFYCLRNAINVEWFYGYANYSLLEYNPLIRFLIYLISVIWILFFKLFVPNKKTFISKVGKNSLSVYLLHYITIFLIVNNTNLLKIGSYPILNCLILAILITCFLSQNWLNDIMRGNFNKNSFSIKTFRSNRGEK